MTLEEQLEIDWPGVFEQAEELSYCDDKAEFDGHSVSVEERNIHSMVMSATCYLSNGDYFEFESNNLVGSRVNEYEKETQKPAWIGIDYAEGYLQERMLKNDESPVSLNERKQSEFNSKCHLCGSPCNRNGKISMCDGGCK